MDAECHKKNTREEKTKQKDGCTKSHALSSFWHVNQPTIKRFL